MIRLALLIAVFVIVFGFAFAHLFNALIRHYGF